MGKEGQLKSDSGGTIHTMNRDKGKYQPRTSPSNIFDKI